MEHCAYEYIYKAGDQLTTKQLSDRYSEHLPMLVAVSRGFHGNRETMTFSTGQVLRLQELRQQDRALVHDDKKNTLSVPLDYTHLFTVKSHPNHTLTLRQVVEKHSLPVEVKFADPNLHFDPPCTLTFLRIIRVCKEPYFIANATSDGEILDAVMPIPLYLKRVTFLPVVGIRGRGTPGKELMRRLIHPPSLDRVDFTKDHSDKEMILLSGKPMKTEDDIYNNIEANLYISVERSRVTRRQIPPTPLEAPQHKTNTTKMTTSTDELKLHSSPLPKRRPVDQPKPSNHYESMYQFLATPQAPKPDTTSTASHKQPSSPLPKRLQGDQPRPSKHLECYQFPPGPQAHKTATTASTNDGHKLPPSSPSPKKRQGGQPEVTAAVATSHDGNHPLFSSPQARKTATTASSNDGHKLPPSSPSPQKRPGGQPEVTTVATSHDENRPLLSRPQAQKTATSTGELRPPPSSPLPKKRQCDQTKSPASSAHDGDRPLLTQPGFDHRTLFTPAASNTRQPSQPQLQTQASGTYTCNHPPPIKQASGTHTCNHPPPVRQASPDGHRPSLPQLQTYKSATPPPERKRIAPLLEKQPSEDSKSTKPSGLRIPPQLPGKQQSKTSNPTSPETPPYDYPPSNRPCIPPPALQRPEKRHDANSRPKTPVSEKGEGKHLDPRSNPFDYPRPATRVDPSQNPTYDYPRSTPVTATTSNHYDYPRSSAPTPTEHVSETGKIPQLPSRPHKKTQRHRHLSPTSPVLFESQREGFHAVAKPESPKQQANPRHPAKAEDDTPVLFESEREGFHAVAKPKSPKQQANPRHPAKAEDDTPVLFESEREGFHAVAKPESPKQQANPRHPAKAEDDTPVLFESEREGFHAVAKPKSPKQQANPRHPAKAEDDTPVLVESEREGFHAVAKPKSPKQQTNPRHPAKAEDDTPVLFESEREGFHAVAKPKSPKQQANPRHPAKAEDDTPLLSEIEDDTDSDGYVDMNDCDLDDYVVVERDPTQREMRAGVGGNIPEAHESSRIEGGPKKETGRNPLLKFLPKSESVPRMPAALTSELKNTLNQRKMSVDSCGERPRQTQPESSKIREEKRNLIESQPKTPPWKMQLKPAPKPGNVYQQKVISQILPPILSKKPRTGSVATKSMTSQPHVAASGETSLTETTTIGPPKKAPLPETVTHGQPATKALAEPQSAKLDTPLVVPKLQREEISEISANLAERPDNQATTTIASQHEDSSETPAKLDHTQDEDLDNPATTTIAAQQEDSSETPAKLDHTQDEDLDNPATTTIASQQEDSSETPAKLETSVAVLDHQQDEDLENSATTMLAPVQEKDEGPEKANRDTVLYKNLAEVVSVADTLPNQTVPVSTHGQGKTPETSSTVFKEEQYSKAKPAQNSATPDTDSAGRVLAEPGYVNQREMAVVGPTSQKNSVADVPIPPLSNSPPLLPPARTVLEETPTKQELETAGRNPTQQETGKDNTPQQETGKDSHSRKQII